MSPPALSPAAFEHYPDFGPEGPARSRATIACFAEVAAELGLPFVDLGALEGVGVAGDGLHFGPEAGEAIGRAVFDAVSSILAETE